MSRYYRCRCGAVDLHVAEVGEEPCARCPRCGSDLARGEADHCDESPAGSGGVDYEGARHEWVHRYAPDDAEYEQCAKCGRLREIQEPPGSTDPA